MVLFCLLREEWLIFMWVSSLVRWVVFVLCCVVSFCMMLWLFCMKFGIC